MVQNGDSFNTFAEVLHLLLNLQLKNTSARLALLKILAQVLKHLPISQNDPIFLAVIKILTDRKYVRRSLQ